MDPHYEVELGSYVLLTPDQIQGPIQLFADHVRRSEAQANTSLIDVMSEVQVAEK